MARSPKFCVFPDAAGQWRWHLAGANGQVVCQGEGHPTKQKALRAAEAIKRLATAATVHVATPQPAGVPSAKKAKPAAVPSAKRAASKPSAVPMTKRAARSGPAGVPMTK